MNELVKRPRPRPGPKKNFSPDSARMNIINACRKALTDLVKRGGVSDPELARRIEAGWNPAVELAVMSVQPDLPTPVKTIILKILLENGVVSATDQARLDAGMDGPSQITIHIEGFAQGRSPEALAAIEPPRVKTGMPALDVIASDKEVVEHRNSKPTAAPVEPQYRRHHVEGEEVVPDADGAIPHPVEVEPADTEIIDSYGTSYRIKRRF